MIEANHGWFVGQDPVTGFYRPCLWTTHCVTYLDYPFTHKEDCLEFIKKEVIGKGLRDE